MHSNTTNEEFIPADFDDRFLSEYLGSVKNDPSIAIIEMVANSWDAGAEHVIIQWPDMEDPHGTICIEDDGCGLSHEDFKTIWPVASYDRTKEQGQIVKIGDGSERFVFGHNGVGRFGMFCFSEQYTVETWKNGECNSYQVSIDKPYRIKHIKTEQHEGHGTRIKCVKKGIMNFISQNDLVDLIRCKFYGKKCFEVCVNGSIIDLSREDPQSPPKIFNTKYGQIVISRYPADSKNRGVVFCVHGRPVGEPSWKMFSEYLDTRRKEFLIQLVVDVDFMCKHVAKDWTGFVPGDVCDDMMSVVLKNVHESLTDIFDTIRSQQKEYAIRANIANIRELPNKSKNKIGKMVDGILEKKPKISGDDLKDIVKVITNCEMSDSGFDLMKKLAAVEPEDIDTLDAILEDWSIREIKIIHNELDSRMNVVKELREIVNRSETEELHKLHPIFKENLWMFGPEYDSCSYQSNRTITTILRESFKVSKPEIDSRRPDLILFPDSSLCAYCTDQFDNEGEVIGFQKIVIIELKRGGFKIGSKEKHQASDYALEIFKNGKMNEDATIMCYVLGSTIDKNVSGDSTEKNGRIIIRPLSYDLLLRRAEARLFNLIRKIEESKPDIVSSGDEVIDKALKESPEISSFDNRHHSI